MHLKDFSESVKTLFSKISSRQAFMSILLISILSFLYFIRTDIGTYINNSDQRKENRYLKELKIEKKAQEEFDSIQREKDRIESELFIYKNNAINDLMSYIERRVAESSSINIFYIHNGGGVPKTGGESKLSLLYTRDNIKGVDLMKDWGDDGQLLSPGYAEYAYQLLNREGAIYYVENINKYPAIYENQTKESLDKFRIKSMMGAWLKTGTKGTYYISLSWDEIDGASIQSEQNVRELLLYARERLINLLDVN